MRRFVLWGLLALAAVSILGLLSDRVLSQVSYPSVSEPTPALAVPPPLDIQVAPGPISPEFVVIQGHVTVIDGNMLTVRSYNIGSDCPPDSRTCLVIPVIPGTTFKVDTSQVVFQSPESHVIQDELKVGDPIIVAGRPASPYRLQDARKNPPTIRALVIERAFVKGQHGGYHVAPADKDIT
jgi:hypothetical protein